MFNKILIANRGEIAVRIISTCREMGITTVAIYSEADHQARHVRAADEAYLIGPAPANQSYLRIDTILEIAQRSAVQAIHPGYGFLSENADFATACQQAGITFIGPPASAMRLMSSKIAAKQLAQSVGAPTVPGYNGEDQRDEVLLHEAQQIGFPLLIKASAGGGGKGMRAVNGTDDFLAQLAGARREALAAFGDETVFLERLIQQPRHIEIQILGDTHGQLIHLGERECSIQRRHQKILEESPSVALTPALRNTMGETAIRIARAAGYTNAGTLEFMLDSDKQFYFLEMNTRLQVEHPVTELVTGLDIVRHQLLIAAGKPLNITQEQVSFRGHAIEVRIYAEDPTQGFLPLTGTITQLVTPQGPGIRIDSGITTADEITQYYDPMLAKLIISAEDRPAAIERLQQALAHYCIFGVTTNIPLLYAISNHPAFQTGQTHTNFLTEHAHSLPLFSQNASLPTTVILAAALYDVQREINRQLESISCGYTQNQQIKAKNPWHVLGPWRMIGDTRTIIYHYQDQTYKVVLRPTQDQTVTWQAQIDSQPPEVVTANYSPDGGIILKRGATRVQTYIQQNQQTTQVAYAGNIYHLQRRQPPVVSSAAHGTGPLNTQKTLTTPMAGTIVKVQVHDGDIVEAHQVLLILSAMKMEHAITAPYEGTVRRVLFQEGSVVPGGTVVVEME